MESQSLQFAAIVRVISAAARAAGCTVPVFRTPPRRPGIERTIRRTAEGGATVAVTLRDRPPPAVVADLIEGVVVANDLAGVEAARLRAVLWQAVVDAMPSVASLPGAA